MSPNKLTCAKETILWQGLCDQVSEVAHMWLRRKRKTQNGPPGPQLTHGLQGIQGHTSSKAKKQQQQKKTKQREQG